MMLIEILKLFQILSHTHPGLNSNGRHTGKSRDWAF